jgi:hypothetical protein
MLSKHDITYSVSGCSSEINYEEHCAKRGIKRLRVFSVSGVAPQFQKEIVTPWFSKKWAVGRAHQSRFLGIKNDSKMRKYPFVASSQLLNL